MKRITLILFAFATMFSLTQCDTASSDTLSNNEDSRAKTISALMNNEAYMQQVMDSMRTKHPDEILSAVFTMAKSDGQMQEKMMNKMTDMCKMDTAMTKMVVGKTMKMLDDSKLDCCATGKMMMGDSMAMNHDAQSDCRAKGKMAIGKTGEMSAVDKLTCCMMASKKTSKVK